MIASFSSFVEANGQPLLDLSLYVSSENYAAITRPIYNTIQSFPLPYLTPPAVRAVAKQRTEHLGLSSLDIDSDDTTHDNSPSIIPESLRRPKITVSSLLAAQPESNAQIRLDAIATAFLEPMNNIRGRKQFFVSDSQFSSLDCLALGYLSLMLIPELPQPWLANTLRNKFPELCSWTESLRKIIFGPDPTTLADAFLTNPGDSEADERQKRLRGRGHLPWKAPDNRSALGIGGVFVSSMVDSIPVVGQLRRNTKMRQHGGITSPDNAQSSSWQYLGVVGSAIAGLGIVAGYMFHQGLFSLPPPEPEKQTSSGGLGAFGEAGEALGFYATQMDSEIQRQRTVESNYTHGEPVVEVDVEVDRVDIRSSERVI